GRRTAGGPVWSPTPTGFAGVPTEEAPSGAVGGQGGRVLVVRDPSALAEAVLREGPTVVLVEGTHTIEPFGTNLEVSSDTSILGVGSGAEIEIGRASGRGTRETVGGEGGGERRERDGGRE